MIVLLSIDFFGCKRVVLIFGPSKRSKSIPNSVVNIANLGKKFRQKWSRAGRKAMFLTSFEALLIPLKR